MDIVALMLEQIQSSGQIAPEQSDAASLQAAALRQLRGVQEAAEPDAGAPVVGMSTVRASLPDWSLPFSGRGNLTAFRYQPDPQCFFSGEDPLLLSLATPGLVEIHADAQQPWPATEQLDAYECRLVFTGLSSEPAAILMEHFRHVADRLECASLRAAGGGEASRDVSSAPYAPGAVVLSEEEQGVVDRLLRAQGRVLQATPGKAGWSGRIRSVGAVLASIDRYRGCDNAERIGEAVEECLALGNGAPLRSLLERCIEEGPASRPLVIDPARSATVSARASAGAANEPARAEDPASDRGPRVLKVSQEKVDRLMDLIGEMVVAKNALPYLAARAEATPGGRDLAREIKNQHAVINRIAEEMQDAIMQVRMLPVATIFQRFPRLVRDISRKLGKHVDLLIEGEDTEADKNIVESLSDPLLHIVRNSLDHGLETPEERRQAGKPATGVLRIRAFQEADRVVIEIEDDGRGIDPERIRAKAVEKGLVDAERACAMTDDEAVQMVFAAGFSTAEAVSDLSGRGVGMDVVRNAIERAHGSVHLASDKGRGTRIRIALPLSMAVTTAMIVRAAGQVYGVQMDHVVETVRVSSAAIHHIKQTRTAVLRGRIVPLYALSDLLGLQVEPVVNEDGEVAVLVVRLLGQYVGVIVDDFDATLDLILKPMDGILSGLSGYAGTSLLGDGSVLMVLNLKELL
jgi:two-component system chemotaxis sensor kinase CheA